MSLAPMCGASNVKPGTQGTPMVSRACRFGAHFRIILSRINVKGDSAILSAPFDRDLELGVMDASSSSGKLRRPRSRGSEGCGRARTYLADRLLPSRSRSSRVSAASLTWPSRPYQPYGLRRMVPAQSVTRDRKFLQMRSRSGGRASSSIRCRCPQSKQMVSTRSNFSNAQARQVVESCLPEKRMSAFFRCRCIVQRSCSAQHEVSRKLLLTQLGRTGLGRSQIQIEIFSLGFSRP